jgi:hypothetical protein
MQACFWINGIRPYAALRQGVTCSPRKIREAGYFFFGSFFFDSKRKNALCPFALLPQLQ